MAFEKKQNLLTYKVYYIFKLQGFLARDVIYTSCAYLMMPLSVCLSVCLSVTFVHCGHRVWWICDTFACLDRWMSLLLTNPDRQMGWCQDFWWKRGVWKKW